MTDKLKRLRESQEYFRRVAKTKVTILRFQDGSSIIGDGRKTLLASPERELELMGNAEVVEVNSIGDARKYLGACLNASYLSLDGEERIRYLTRLAKDYRDVLNFPVKSLVKVLAEDTSTSPCGLRRYLPDEFKEAKKKHVGMRYGVSHPKEPVEHGVSDRRVMDKSEMIDYLLNWLDQEDPIITEDEAKFLRTLRGILNRIKIPGSETDET